MLQLNLLPIEQDTVEENQSRFITPNINDDTQKQST